MKVAAHPIVVAVALGLLGPGALEHDRELAPAASNYEAPPVVDKAEQDRAAAMWLQARATIDHEG